MILKMQKDDYDAEYLDYQLNVGVVDSITQALQHITRHSTHHSEAIITNSQEHADLFTRWESIQRSCMQEVQWN